MTVHSLQILPGSPSSYPTRKLLAVTGMTPQVLTETLFALVRPESGEPFVPTEIHVLTTAEGMRQIELRLLDLASGHFHALCRDYGLPPIAFDRSHIQTLTDAQGDELEDIRSPEESQRAADAIMDWVRSHTQDADCAVHVSLAGGRKTMGFYAGYALSLFGREQDRLSHVLVSAPFEQIPDFFYPPPQPRVLQTADKLRTARSSDARIFLADIPFVRLRYGLPEPVKTGTTGFSATVVAAQSGLGPIGIELDVPRQVLRCGGRDVALAPQLFAFYLWHARRAKALGAAAFISQRDADDVIGDFLACYLEVLEWDDAHPDFIKLRKALEHGFDKDTWAERVSRIEKAVRLALSGANAEPYRFSRKRCGRGKALAIALAGVPQERISIIDMPLKSV
ncbi:CRISPR-associated ring nuclease Csm6 [Niveibacterium sp. COAC-50]|uniref:CRISPR-associated ring nuclease Csm6 n=1 Tax=Niveibacterium sp. COAC-50 TaxID=2729384 RepID=UPI001552179A|nr:CRISPR-associated ring nuclease Csm6 [Niveibacterium sp. COAC-50]